MNKAAVRMIGTIAMALAISSQAAEQPNVLLILADDLGYADMSFLSFASKDLQTPGIDRIAKAGTYFSNAYATAAICSPSRVGLATGRYQQRWGNVWYGSGGLPATEKTIAMELKALGYVTKKIGKNHMNSQQGDNSHPLKHGFDEFFGFNGHTKDYRRHTKAAAKASPGAGCGPLDRNGKDEEYEDAYATELFTDDALEYLQRDHRGKPFFLQVSYNAVHHPVYVGHPEYEKKFGLEPFPLYDKESQGPFYKWHQQWGKGEGHDPELRKRYLATLACMDDGIAKILDTVKSKGLQENTIVIFLSDNGGAPYTMSNNKPLKGNKYCEAEGGCRIPMIVSWPEKLPMGKSLGALVSAMDIYPTLVEAAGGKPHSKLDGKSLAPLLSGKTTADNHDYLVLSRGAEQGDYAVRSGDWKLRVCKTLRLFTVGKHYEYDDVTGSFLYNLKDDLSESKNLFKAAPEKAMQLQANFDEWYADVQPPNGAKGVKLKKKK